MWNFYKYYDPKLANYREVPKQCADISNSTTWPLQRPASLQSVARFHSSRQYSNQFVIRQKLFLIHQRLHRDWLRKTTRPKRRKYNYYANIDIMAASAWLADLYLD